MVTTVSILSIMRTGKVRANREKALLSHIFNFARENGYTDTSNPCIGVKGKKENARTRYVEDDCSNTKDLAPSNKPGRPKKNPTSTS